MPSSQTGAATQTTPKPIEHQHILGTNPHSNNNKDGSSVTHGHTDTFDDTESDHDIDEIRRRIFQVIEYSFASNIRKKIKRLFVFIMTFGYNTIGFTQSGNVTVNGSLIDKKSNAIELLEACAIGLKGSSKPPGYDQFLSALKVINVPANFTHQLNSATNNDMPVNRKRKYDEIDNTVDRHWKRY